MFGERTQTVHNGGGGWQVGVAQAEVIHIVRAKTGLELASGLEHAADPRRVFQIPRNAVCKNGHILLPLVVVFDLTIGYASKSRIKQLSFGGPDAF